MSHCIDVHSHIVPADFPMAPEHCCDHWPHMVHHQGDDASIMIGAREFRQIDNRSWHMPRRLADMDAEQVAMQALSPMPELLSYWLDAADTLALGRHVNGAIAAMIAAQPARFAGLGMVPLQDVALAARELSRLKADGLHGVEIGSNILGKAPGDPQFDAFYAEAERLDMAIFVHALHPLGNDRLVGPKPLEAFISFPSDTGFAAASFITGGTLKKFPKLRVAFSHGGGTLASILPRLHHGWTLAPPLHSAFDSPLEAARRMFYDNVVFDPATLRHIIAMFGETQIFAGSDYPYAAGQSFPGRPFADLDLSDAATDQLMRGNALRFLGMVNSQASHFGISPRGA